MGFGMWPISAFSVPFILVPLVHFFCIPSFFAKQVRGRLAGTPTPPHCDACFNMYCGKGSGFSSLVNSRRAVHVRAERFLRIKVAHQNVPRRARTRKKIERGIRVTSSTTIYRPPVTPADRGLIGVWFNHNSNQFPRNFYQRVHRR